MSQWPGQLVDEPQTWPGVAVEDAPIQAVQTALQNGTNRVPAKNLGVTLTGVPQPTAGPIIDQPTFSGPRQRLDISGAQSTLGVQPIAPRAAVTPFMRARAADEMHREAAIEAAAKAITPERIAQARAVNAGNGGDTGTRFYTDDDFARRALAEREVAGGDSIGGAVPDVGPTGVAGFARNVGQGLARFGQFIPGAIGEASQEALEAVPGTGVGGFVGSAIGGLAPIAAGPVAPALFAGATGAEHIREGDIAGAGIHGAIDALNIAGVGRLGRAVGGTVAGKAGRAAGTAAQGVTEGVGFSGGGVIAHTLTEVAEGKKTVMQALAEIEAQLPGAVAAGAIGGLAARAPSAVGGAVARHGKDAQARRAAEGRAAMETVREAYEQAPRVPEPSRDQYQSIPPDRPDVQTESAHPDMTPPDRAQSQPEVQSPAPTAPESRPPAPDTEVSRPSGEDTLIGDQQQEFRDFAQRFAGISHLDDAVLSRAFSEYSIDKTRGTDFLYDYLQKELGDPRSAAKLTDELVAELDRMIPPKEPPRVEPAPEAAPAKTADRQAQRDDSGQPEARKPVRMMVKVRGVNELAAKGEAVDVTTLDLSTYENARSVAEQLTDNWNDTLDAESARAVTKALQTLDREHRATTRQVTPEELAKHGGPKAVNADIAGGSIRLFVDKEADTAAVKKLASKAVEIAKIKGAGTVSKSHAGLSTPLRNPVGLTETKIAKTTEDRIASIAANRSTDPGRYAIKGVLVANNGKRMVVTDGRAMSILDSKTKGEFGKDGLYGDSENPLDKGVLKETSKGAFPPYEDVIPKPVEPEAVIRIPSLRKLIQNLREISVITDENSKMGVAVYRNPDGSLGFAAHVPDMGQAEVALQRNAVHMGNVNPVYLADQAKFVLSTTGTPGLNDAPATFEWAKPTKPMVLKNMGPDGREATGILMPVNAVGDGDYRYEPIEAAQRAEKEAQQAREAKKKRPADKSDHAASPDTPLSVLPSPDVGVTSPRLDPAPLKGGDTKPIAEIMRDLGASIDKTIRHAQGERGSKGVYYPSSTRTSTRFANDLSTGSHEIGHALDDLVSLVGQYATPRAISKSGAKLPQKSPFDKELFQPAFQQTTQDHYNKPMKRAESVAEFARAWMVNPDAAKSLAPTFAAHFEKTVPADVLAKLREAGDAMRRFAGSSSIEKTQAAVRLDTKEPPIKQRLGDAIKGKEPGGDLLTTVQSAMTDSLAPVIKNIRAARELKGLPGDESLSVRQLRLLAGTSTKVDSAIERGMIEYGSKQRVKGVGGMEWHLEPLKDIPGDVEANRRLVASLLVSQRTIERSTRIIDATAKVMEGEKRLVELRQLLAEARKNNDGDGEEMGSLIDEIKATIAEINQTKRSVGYSGASRGMPTWAKGVTNRMTGAGGGFYSASDVATSALREFADMRTKEPARMKGIEESAARLRKTYDASLKYLLDSGRISQEQYDTISASNQYYVSFQRVMEEIDPMGYKAFGMLGGGAKRPGSVGKPIQRQIAGTQTIEDPFVMASMAVNAAIKEGDRNAAMRSVWQEFKNTREMYKGRPLDFDQFASKAKAGDQNTIAIYTDGKPEYVQFNAPMYKALKGWQEAPSDPLPARMLQIPGNITRWSVTHAPPFWMANTIRDTTIRPVLSRVGSTPLDTIKILGEDFRALTDEFYRAGGGNFGNFHGGDPKTYRKALDRAIDKVSGHGNTIVSTFPKLADGWNELSHRTETVGRLTEYKKARDKALAAGKSYPEAMEIGAAESRDLQDFSRGGYITRYVARYIPFMNAAVQSLSRVARGINENPTQFAKRWFAVIGTMELLNYGWNAATGDEEEVRRLPAYQRDFFWNYKIGPDLWISIPRPWELGVMGSAIGRSIDAARGIENPYDGWAENMAEAVTPTRIDQTILGPMREVVAQWLNVDPRSGQRIIPEHEKNLDLDLRTGDDKASAVGRMLQDVLGIDARRIDHAISGTFGHFGRIATSKDTGQAAMRTSGIVQHSSVASEPVVRDAYDLAARRGKSGSRQVRLLTEAIKNVRDGKPGWTDEIVRQRAKIVLKMLESQP